MRSSPEGLGLVPARGFLEQAMAPRPSFNDGSKPGKHFEFLILLVRNLDCVRRLRFKERNGQDGNLRKEYYWFGFLILTNDVRLCRLPCYASTSCSPELETFFFRHLRLICRLSSDTEDFYFMSICTQELTLQ